MTEERSHAIRFAAALLCARRALFRWTHSRQTRVTTFSISLAGWHPADRLISGSIMTNKRYA